MMSDECFSAREIYCPECDEDYRLAFSDEHDDIFVVCGCSETETAADFIGRFLEEHTNTADERMYQ